MRAKAEKLAFHQGVLFALAHVAQADIETLHAEIVREVGIDALREACEGPEDYEFSGLVRYGWLTPMGRKRSRAYKFKEPGLSTLEGGR